MRKFSPLAMSSRRILATASILALLLVALVPVEATPVLQKGAHSSYTLNVTISSVETCETFGTTTTASNVIVCPMIAGFPMSTRVNGTVAWSVTDLSSRSALLNVTHDLTISNGETIRPLIQNTGSFNESVDLATRLVSLFPGIMSEMDQFLQAAQSTASASLPGINLASSMTTLESFIPQRSLYTMWWVNGPLKLNETVPVLVLPTNVTRASTVDLGGSIGSRDAWTLNFNFSRPIIVPDTSAALAPIPGGSVEAGFVFNYDKTSDLLLSANAELHSGFEDVIQISPSPCVPSASTSCPAASSPTMIRGIFGVDVEASLKLTDTNLDLSQRMNPTIPPQSSRGSDNGAGSGTSAGTGSGNGSNEAGSNTGGNGANGSTGQPSSATNQPDHGAQVSNWPLWIFGLLGVLAAMIVASVVWISRRRLRNNARLDSTPGQAAS